MDIIIKVEDLNYQYEANKMVLENVSFQITKGSFVTIAGSIGSGKSTLIKIFLGYLRIGSFVKIEDTALSVENKNKIREKIEFIDSNPEDFAGDTVKEELTLELEKQHLSQMEIKKKVQEISHTLNIYDLLNKKPKTLSRSEKIRVSFARILIKKKNILILDESLSLLSNLEKKNIIQVLKKLQKERNLTILNFTKDLEESIYSDEIILLNNGKVILQGKKESVLKEEKIMKQIGLEVPFIVDLSIRLMYYGVLDNIIFDMDEMVNTIWK